MQQQMNTALEADIKRASAEPALPSYVLFLHRERGIFLRVAHELDECLGTHI